MEDAPKPELENGEDEISIADIVSRLAALETAFGDYKSKMEEMPKEEMAEEKKDEESAMAAQFSALNSKLDTVIKTFGAAPMKGSAAAVGKSDEAIDLKKVIEKKTGELGSRTAAIKFAMNNHPAEYIALRDSNQLNF
jgi:ribosomal protein L9